MIGISIARITRSGTQVGPGICKKCRPVCVTMFESTFPDATGLNLSFLFYVMQRQFHYVDVLEADQLALFLIITIIYC
jgi:hypothetical protein